MAGFNQSQLQVLESINPSTGVRRPNPILAKMEQLPSTSKVSDTLNNIETNQFLQTRVLANSFSSAVAIQNSTSANLKSTALNLNETSKGLVQNSDAMISLNTNMIEATRAVAELPDTLDKLRIDLNTTGRLFTFDRSKIRQAQFEKGVGKEARFANKLSKQLRTSASAALAFSIPAARISRSNMSVDERKIALLQAIHDVSRFSGQELISIRKGDSSNQFAGVQSLAADRSLGQRVSDSLQTLPIIAPLVTVGKTLTSVTKTLLTPATTMVPKVIALMDRIKTPINSKLSTGTDLAVKAGLGLDHKKVAFQFLATDYPTIARETNMILNRQLGVQENIQGILEDTYALFSKNSPQRRLNQRDAESVVYDPFLGQYVSQSNAKELENTRFKRLVATRRRERGMISRLSGFGKKADTKAAKDAMGSTVNQVGGAHSKNILESNKGFAKADKKLLNSIEIMSSVIGMAALGPIGLLVGRSLAGAAAFQLKKDGSVDETLIEDILRTKLSDMMGGASAAYSNKFESKFSKQDMADKANSSFNGGTSSSSSATKTPSSNVAVKANISKKQTITSKLQSIKQKDSAENLVAIQTEELSTLKAVLVELKKSKTKEKGKGGFGWLGKMLSKGFGFFKMALGGLSSIVGGVLTSIGGLGAIVASAVTIGFGVVAKMLKGMFGPMISSFGKILKMLGLGALGAVGLGGSKGKRNGKVFKFGKGFGKGALIAAAAAGGAYSLFGGSEDVSASALNEQPGALQDQPNSGVSVSDGIGLAVNSAFVASSAKNVYDFASGRNKVSPVQPKVPPITKPQVTHNQPSVKYTPINNPIPKKAGIFSRVGSFISKFNPMKVGKKFKAIGKFASKVIAKRLLLAAPIALIPGIGVGMSAILGLWSAYDIAKYAYDYLTGDSEPSEDTSNMDAGMPLIDNLVSSVNDAGSIGGMTMPVVDKMPSFNSTLPPYNTSTSNISGSNIGFKSANRRQTSTIGSNISNIPYIKPDLAPIVDKAAKRWGLDPRLVLQVINAESSGGRNTSVSSAGAVGVMQLMPATARDLGVTDINDPEQNINAGAKYLSILKDKYSGNIPMAVAAYNWGFGNLDRKGPEQAPKETRDYVRKITGLDITNLPGGDLSASSIYDGGLSSTVSSAINSIPSMGTVKSKASSVMDSIGKTASTAYDNIDTSSPAAIVNSTASTIGSTVSSAMDSIGKTASTAYDNIDTSSPAAIVNSTTSTIGSTVSSAMDSIGKTASTAYTYASGTPIDTIAYDGYNTVVGLASSGVNKLMSAISSTPEVLDTTSVQLSNATNQIIASGKTIVDSSSVDIASAKDSLSELTTVLTEKLSSMEQRISNIQPQNTSKELSQLVSVIGSKLDNISQNISATMASTSNTITAQLSNNVPSRSINVLDSMVDSLFDNTKDLIALQAKQYAGTQ